MRKHKKIYYSIIVISIFLVSCTYSVNAQDFNLHDCIQYAKSNNKDLKRLTQETVVFQKDIDVSKGDFFPKIYAKSSLDYYWKIPVQGYPSELLGQTPGTIIPVKVGTPYTTYVDLGVEWDVFNAETWFEYKVKQLSKKRHEFDMLSDELKVERNIKATYSTLVLLDKYKTMRDTLFDTMKQIIQIIENKGDEGLYNRIDLNLSQVILNEFNVSNIKFNFIAKEAILSLKGWMNFPLESHLSLNLSNDSALYDSLVRDLEKSSLFVLNVKRRSVIEEIENLYAKKTLSSIVSPRIKIVGNIGYTGLDETMLGLFHKEWHLRSFIGINLTIPIFSYSEIKRYKKQQAIVNSAKTETLSLFNKKKEYSAKLKLKIQQNLSLLKRYKESLSFLMENNKIIRQRITEGVDGVAELKNNCLDILEILDKIETLEIEYVNNKIEYSYEN